METRQERDQTAMVVKAMRKLLDEQSARATKIDYFAIIAIISILLISIFLGCGLANASSLDSNKAIIACIGEAEGETYGGKLMLMYTLINRGHFKGVYGLKAPRVVNKKYSQKTYNQCKQAWDYAVAHPNPTWNATGWGNELDIAEFQKHKWWKNCIVVAHVGNHFFYAERK